MNWMGGARSRISKSEAEKRQKAYFAARQQQYQQSIANKKPQTPISEPSQDLVRFWHANKLSKYGQTSGGASTSKTEEKSNPHVLPIENSESLKKVLGPAILSQSVIRKRNQSSFGGALSRSLPILQDSNNNIKENQNPRLHNSFIGEYYQGDENNGTNKKVRLRDPTDHQVPYNTLHQHNNVTPFAFAPMLNGLSRPIVPPPQTPLKSILKKYPETAPTFTPPCYVSPSDQTPTNSWYNTSAESTNSPLVITQVSKLKSGYDSVISANNKFGFSKDRNEFESQQFDIQNQCQSNVLQNQCQSNVLQNQCQNNEFQNQCQNNEFQNRCLNDFNFNPQQFCNNYENVNNGAYSYQQNQYCQPQIQNYTSQTFYPHHHAIYEPDHEPTILPQREICPSSSSTTDSTEMTPVRCNYNVLNDTSGSSIDEDFVFEPSGVTSVVSHTFYTDTVSFQGDNSQGSVAVSKSKEKIVEVKAVKSGQEKIMIYKARKTASYQITSKPTRSSKQPVIIQEIPESPIPKKKILTGENSREDISGEDNCVDGEPYIHQEQYSMNNHERLMFEIGHGLLYKPTSSRKSVASL